MKLNHSILKILFLSLIYFIGFKSHSQVGIGTEDPNPDSKIEIASPEENPGGLLLPRLHLENILSPSPLNDHVAGMTVYNLTDDEDIGSGFYYNDGEKWVKINESSEETREYWKISGNRRISSGHFIGTRDNQKFVIKTRNQKSLEIGTDGSLKSNDLSTSFSEPSYSWWDEENKTTGFSLAPNLLIGFLTDGNRRVGIPFNDQILGLSFGTEEAPFYTWAEASQTGLFLPQRNFLGFAVGGNMNFLIQSRGLFKMGEENHHSDVPSYSWNSSKTTGLFLPEEHALGFTTSAEERVRLPNVPQLLGMSPGSENAPFFAWNEAPGLGISNTEEDHLAFSSEGEEKFRITDRQLLKMGIETGSEAEPTFSWAESPSTGMFIDENDIGFSTDALERIRIPDTTQLFAMQNGTENRPFYSWTHAPGTGIFKISNQTLGFSVSEKEVFRINSSGQLLKNNENKPTARPDYSWDSSTSTGILMPENLNAIGFSARNEKFRIPDRYQVLGIGGGSEQNPFYSWESNRSTGVWGSGSEGSIVFSTNAIRRLRIYVSGRVYVNQTSSDIEARLSIRADDPGNYTLIATGIEGGTALIGIVDPAGANLAGDFEGDMSVSGDIFVGSDRRLKKTTQPLSSDDLVFQRFLNLKPSKYNWNTEQYPFLHSIPQETSYGFIAQELKEEFPDLVHAKPLAPENQQYARGSNDEYLSINYIEVIPLLTHGIQENQKKIQDAHGERLSALELKAQQLIEKKRRKN